tara:strand:- start:182 stop:664 length:483 start_codon:yes stop_codon:yes gene_type:complete
MARLKQSETTPNFFGIGIYNVSNEVNIGTLWRSAFVLGASFIYTIGRKYEQQGSDVYQTWTQIPLYHYNSVEDLKSNLPYSTRLIAIEISPQAQDLCSFEHPDRAVYLLGSEMYGLPESVLGLCHQQVVLPGNLSLNVAATGSIVLYDRISKIPTQLPKP